MGNAVSSKTMVATFRLMLGSRLLWGINLKARHGHLCSNRIQNKVTPHDCYYIYYFYDYDPLAYDCRVRLAWSLLSKTVPSVYSDERC